MDKMNKIVLDGDIDEALKKFNYKVDQEIAKRKKDKQQKDKQQEDKQQNEASNK